MPSLLRRVSNLLARMARRVREVPSLHPEVDSEMVDECEQAAHECHAADEASSSTSTARAPDGPGDGG